jgi:hypothetical protein
MSSSWESFVDEVCERTAGAPGGPVGTRVPGAGLCRRLSGSAKRSPPIAAGAGGAADTPLAGTGAGAATFAGPGLVTWRGAGAGALGRTDAAAGGAAWVVGGCATLLAGSGARTTGARTDFGAFRGWSVRSSPQEGQRRVPRALYASQPPQTMPISSSMGSLRG